MNKAEKAKTRKDRIFIIVMAIVIANLSYILLQVVPYLVTGGYANIWAWATTVANVVGIIGCLWLVKEERKRRRSG